MDAQGYLLVAVPSVVVLAGLAAVAARLKRRAR